MEKYKINLMENSPDDKDVARYMNFEKVVAKYHVAALWKKLVIGSVSTGGIVLAVATAIYFSGNSSQNTAGYNPEIDDSKTVTEIIVDEPEPGNLAEGNIPIAIQSEKTEVVDPQPVSREPEETLKKESVESPKRIEVTEEGQSYNYSFKKANPVMGFDSLYRYLQENMKIPDSSEGIKGKVIVSFSVDTLGRPVKIKILEGLTDEINSEAIRLIKDMPAWDPAELNGKPVETSLSIPIYLEIVKSDNQE